MQHRFYTIGHSTRSIPAFIELLKVPTIELVVDVRTIPRSRTNPQFNSDVLAEALRKHQIEYQHIATLGGLRSRSREVPFSTNAFWKNDSFHNYADYAMTERFQQGLAELRELGHARTTVIMCSEAVWWRCHRRIIADYLINAGERVFHILGEKSIRLARMTEAAQPRPDGTIAYPTLCRAA